MTTITARARVRVHKRAIGKDPDTYSTETPKFEPNGRKNDMTRKLILAPVLALTVALSATSAMAQSAQPAAAWA